MLTGKQMIQKLSVSFFQNLQYKMALFLSFLMDQLIYLMLIVTWKWKYSTLFKYFQINMKLIFVVKYINKIKLEVDMKLTDRILNINHGI